MREEWPPASREPAASFLEGVRAAAMATDKAKIYRQQAEQCWERS